MSVASQTEQDADSLRTHLQAIVGDSDDAILSESLEGTIVSWNKAAQGIYGYSADEVVGRSVSVLVPEDRADEVPRFLDAIRRERRIDSYETVRLDKWGKRLPVSLTISPIKDSDGAVVGASTIARDVTVRQRAERELAAARNQAAEASRLKSEFVATMSHEIRTPLNGVIGMTHLLLDTDLGPEQREYAETIRISGDLLLTLISDILDFSKIDSGKMELEEVDFDVRDTVEEAAQLLAERAHAKGLRLATLIEPDVPTGIRGDPHRLRQVLANLLSNAVKFTDEGEIVVRASVAEKGQDSILLSLEVEDTGIGIPPDVQRRVFKIFSQADASSTREYGGTGLGLAIARQLTQLMGGNIGVESEEGKGSRFWFRVRLSTSSREFISPPVPSATLAGVRILVVGDNATNRKVFEQTLLSWDMRPALAESGEQALGMLRDAASQGEPYAVTLLDFGSPEMDGMALAREIKKDLAVEGVAVALITSSQPTDAPAEEDAGVVCHLTLPVRRRTLHDCMVGIVEPGRPAGPEDLVLDKPPTEPAEPSHLPVLVVEDNAGDQEVAR